MIELIAYSEVDGKTKIEMIGFDNEEEIIKAQIDSITESKDKAKVLSTVSSEDLLMEMNLAVDNTKVDCTVKLDSEGTVMEVISNQEIKNTGNVEIEEFDANNSVKLNDMTSQDIETLVQTIYTNVMKVLPQKMQLLGINTGV